MSDNNINAPILSEFPNYNSKDFVEDGIVNEKIWSKTFPKIVYVLKETNEHNSCLTKLLNEPFLTIDDKIITDESRRIKDLRPTWFNIARWTYGQTNKFKSNKKIYWKKLNSNDDWYKKGWLDELKKTAIINIKKTPGKAVSNYEELTNAVTDYGRQTWNQINYYKPNIVIFCGVSSIFNKYFLKEKKIIKKNDWKQTKTGYWYFRLEKPKCVYIQFWHPNAHFPNNMMFYSLLDIVKETIMDI